MEEWGTRQRDLMERLPSTLTLSLGCMVPATWADIWIASAACPYHNDYRRSSCARSKCFMQPKHRPSVDTVDAILHTQRFDGLLLHGDKKRSHHHKHTIYPRHHEVFRDMTPQKTSHSNTAKTMACCPITKRTCSVYRRARRYHISGCLHLLRFTRPQASSEMQ